MNCCESEHVEFNACGSAKLSLQHLAAQLRHQSSDLLCKVKDPTSGFLVTKNCLRVFHGSKLPVTGRVVSVVQPRTDITMT